MEPSLLKWVLFLQLLMCPMSFVLQQQGLRRIEKNSQKTQKMQMSQQQRQQIPTKLNSVVSLFRNSKLEIDFRESNQIGGQQEQINEDIPSRPQFSSQWFSSLDLSFQIDGKPVFAAKADESYVVQNNEKKRSILFQATKQNVPKEFLGTDLEFFNQTTFSSSCFSGLDLNGVKVENSIPFTDIFAWFQGAIFVGREPKNGHFLDHYALKVPKFTGHLYYNRELDQPVFMEEYIITGPSSSLHMAYEFFTFVRDFNDDSYWANIHKSNFTDPPICEPLVNSNNRSRAEPVLKDVFVFGPKDLNINSQDLADLTGVSHFMCYDLASNQTTIVDHNYEWLTYWKIEFFPQFGQYQLCNGYPPQCIGTNNFLIGHEAALGLGKPLAGQCTDNPLVGEWWSLPEKGRCSPHTKPDGKICTWRIVERVKTIDYRCLLNAQNFKHVCSLDKRPPYLKASQVIEKALKYKEEELGGCPALKV